MLTREKLREGVLGSNRTAYMNYIVPLLFPDNEMPAGRLRHWAELWREADITSEHVCGMPREQRAYLEAALAGRWIYLRLLQCFWKFKTARRKMFRGVPVMIRNPLSRESQRPTPWKNRAALHMSCVLKENVSYSDHVC